MKFRNHGSNHAEQWQVYRQLEAIPESVPNPYEGQRWLTTIPNAVTRAIAALRPAPLHDGSHIEHLEACWALSLGRAAEPKIQPVGPWQPRLWLLDGNFESPVPQKSAGNFKYGLINPDLWLT